MKWKDFKEYVESRGVNDDTILAYNEMNFGGNAGNLHKMSVDIDKEANELRFDSMSFQDVDQTHNLSFKVPMTFGAFE